MPKYILYRYMDPLGYNLRRLGVKAGEFSLKTKRRLEAFFIVDAIGFGV